MIPHTRTASPRMTSTISNSFRLRILIVCTRRIHLPHTSDNETGQEAGICTRTVSFTGRDAADYTTVLFGWQNVDRRLRNLELPVFILRSALNWSLRSDSHRRL